MGKVMRHTLAASLNIRHNLSSSKGPRPLHLQLLTTYIPKTSAFTLAFSPSQRLRTTRASAGRRVPVGIPHSAYARARRRSAGDPALAARAGGRGGPAGLAAAGAGRGRGQDGAVARPAPGGATAAGGDRPCARHAAEGD